MKTLLDRIRHSEFLTFNEVLRLKLIIVTVFISVFVILSYISAPLSTSQDNTFLFVLIAFSFLFLLTILFIAINSNRIAMHLSIITILGITFAFVNSSNYFYGFIMFFVSLTVIIFYHDIVTYLIYGGLVTGYGCYYIITNGSYIVGTNSLNPLISQDTYLIVLLGFYIVFLIQFIVSDSIYEKMNNEWLKMSKILSRYQSFSTKYIDELKEKNKETAIYDSSRFQQTVNELSTFINEFFEEDGSKIAEVVEYYFFLHSQDIDEIINSAEGSVLTKRYAKQFKKYMLNDNSEMISLLYDFATLFKETPDYSIHRYKYHLSDLFENRVDKLIALAFLYKYLKTEATQYDKYGSVKRMLAHDEITEMFISKEFREFLSFELVNFYLDNQELFREHL
ncbi:MAG: hypothetical protein K9L26_01390 [Candidatus Izimaplasma sp.]|nr:hypothetical protein [Candidatus Izimaplasma bacterium]